MDWMGSSSDVDGVISKLALISAATSYVDNPVWYRRVWSAVNANAYNTRSISLICWYPKALSILDGYHEE